MEHYFERAHIHGSHLANKKKKIKDLDSWLVNQQKGNNNLKLPKQNPTSKQRRLTDKNNNEIFEYCGNYGTLIINSCILFQDGIKITTWAGGTKWKPEAVVAQSQLGSPIDNTSVSWIVVKINWF